MPDMHNAIKGEIDMKDEAHRRSLAEKYNLSEHRDITMIFDGSLFQVKKSIDKLVQADNWGYKGYECRNVQFGILVDGSVASIPSSDQGKSPDITNAKYAGVYKQLAPSERGLYDKGYDGIQEYSNACLPIKKRKGVTRTPAEKEESNKLKSLRILVENTINCVKQFKILKYVFPYPIEGGLKATKFDSVVSTCAALVNIHLRSHPIRTPRIPLVSNPIMSIANIL